MNTYFGCFVLSLDKISSFQTCSGIALAHSGVEDGGKLNVAIVFIIRSDFSTNDNNNRGKLSRIMQKKGDREGEEGWERRQGR